MKKFAYILTIAFMMVFGLTACRSEAEKEVEKAKAKVEESAKVLASIPLGDPDELDMDGEPPPEGEKEASGYITDNAVTYIDRCMKRKQDKIVGCYEELGELFDKETDRIIKNLVTNIHLLPNEFQKKAVQDEVAKIRSKAGECGNSADCQAGVAAEAYNFAVWIDRQAIAYKESKKRPVDVRDVGPLARYCASSAKPVQMYDHEGNPSFVLNPKEGKMVFFTVYVSDDGKSIAVESRDKFEPFQFNGRILGYVDPAMREEFTKGGHFLACQNLNTIYRN